MHISFNNIPGHNKLFLDYLYDYTKVHNFYNHNFRDHSNIKDLFENIASKKAKRNFNLSDLLSNQYSELNPSQRTLDNINSLNSNKTLAVVTGQQLGILGGPLYTVYKIITTIKLCDKLKTVYNDYDFVPVFWLEGDDHDFNEVRSVNIIDNNNELVKLSYGSESAVDDDRASVGYLKLNEEITEFIDSLKNSLRNTEFTDEIIKNISELYKPGNSFKDAFKRLLFNMFDQKGLILFDPQDKEVKTLLKPIFIEEIKNFREHSAKIISVSAKLEEEYFAQVKIRPVNLFFSNDQGRFLIEPVEDNLFRLKRKKQKFTFDELLSFLENEPERFSPNVLLRPICQDYILPTAFYIGGPGEIAYFAQVNCLYELFNLQAPVIYPRSSATLLEKNIISVLEKNNLAITDIFSDQDEIKNKVINRLSNNSLDEIFDKNKLAIENQLNELLTNISLIDKSLIGTGEKTKQKIFNYLDELKNKSTEAQKRKFEIILRQIEKAYTNIFPNGILQERVLNLIYFQNKYGNELPNRIFDELSIDKFEHQVIEL